MSLCKRGSNKFVGKELSPKRFGFCAYEEQLYKVLEYLLYVTEIKWRNQVMKYRDIMGYDPGNTIIKRVLRQEGVQIEG